MGLMDDFHEERYGPPIKCPVHRTAEAMTPEDGADLRRAVDENLIPAQAIARVLERKGIILKSDAINRHRRKECGCGK